MILTLSLVCVLMGRRLELCSLLLIYDPRPNAQGEKTPPDRFVRKTFKGRAGVMESLLSRHMDVYEITKEE